MRYGAFALLVLALAACNRDISGPSGGAVVSGARALTANGWNVDVSVPDTIYADPATGKCDIPLTYVADYGLATPAYFDSGSVRSAGTPYSYNKAAYQAVMGTSIQPGTTYTGVIPNSSLLPAHLGTAPYTGNVIFHVHEGANHWWALLEYLCLPAGSQKPPKQGGQPPAEDPGNG